MINYLISLFLDAVLKVPRKCHHHRQRKIRNGIQETSETRFEIGYEDTWKIIIINNWINKVVAHCVLCMHFDILRMLVGGKNSCSNLLNMLVPINKCSL